MRARVVLLCVVVLGALAFALRAPIGAWFGAGSVAGDGESEEPMLGRWPRSQFYMERDRFIAAIDPTTIPAARAVWLRDDDEVYGVVLGGKARAYPITMICYHHVVNDVIQGIPVAVTY
jgi:hypothetical protein